MTTLNRKPWPRVAILVKRWKICIPGSRTEVSRTPKVCNSGHMKGMGAMSTQNLTDKEAEAVVATDMATELLQEFFGYIQKDLRHYSEKYADYRVYSEYAGVLAEDKDELLGRLTAWNYRTTQGVGSTFLIISVWEPGKDPKARTGITW